MKASIIIPTYNGEKKIAKLLSLLENQVDDDIELIVVIDGSSDNTLKVLSEKDWKIKNLKLINQENKGRAGARNAGADFAQNEILIFFDDDIEPCLNLVKAHIYEQSNKDIVVGYLESSNKNTNSEMLAFSNYLNDKWSTNVFEVENSSPYITAANFSIKRDLFIKMGGFDARLNDSEDLDLAIRLTEKGFKISHVKELKAIITLNNKFSDTFKRLKEYKKGREKLYAIRPDLKFRMSQNQSVVNPFKKAGFYFFSFPFLISLIDMGFFKFMPIKARFKLYDWMMTANMLY